jgi:hypothetical protein
MANINYYRSDGEENHKQWYWGAFMLGRVAFYRHQSAGYWLTDKAVSALALHRFAEVDATGRVDRGLLVDDGSASGSFEDGFCAGYRQQGNQMGRDGLQLLPKDPGPPR